MQPLGFITKIERTPEQEESHGLAEARMLFHSLPTPKLPPDGRVVLTDAWRNALVKEDTGRTKFPRIHQKTGSCVWAGGTNGMLVTIGTQRLLPEPTKAFIPFTLGNYAMSRHAFGDDGQGEGSLGSTFQASLKDDGYTEWTTDRTDKLPDFTEEDGLGITDREEMKWSSYRNPDLKDVLTVSKSHLLGTSTICKSAQDIKALVLNGYGGSFACNNFIGDASVQGSGKSKAVCGKWGGRGGHQQWFFGYWENTDLGPLYAAGNNWNRDTYPLDEFLPECCCWVKEADVDAAFRLDSEVYGFSHLNWFPAQPAVPTLFDWYA